MTKIDKLITNFLTDLEKVKGRSWRTVRNYDLYLRRFSYWLKENKIKQADKITPGAVKEYHVWLNKVKDPIRKANLKKSTQNYHLIAVRAFLKYLAKKRFKSLPADEVKLTRLPKVGVDFLEKNDLEKLLAAPLDVKQNKIIQVRDKAILELLFCSGLKVSELARLRKQNIKTTLLLRSGQAKQQNNKLSNQAKHWVEKYLEIRKDKNEFLFIGHDRAINQRARKQEPKGLTPRSIERVVRRYAKLAGIEKKVTPHTLRHTFARNFLIKGKSLQDLQGQLGHSAISTTKMYLK